MVGEDNRLVAEPRRAGAMRMVGASAASPKLPGAARMALDPGDAFGDVLARISHQKLEWDLDLLDNVSVFNNLH